MFLTFYIVISMRDKYKNILGKYRNRHHVSSI